MGCNCSIPPLKVDLRKPSDHAGDAKIPGEHEYGDAVTYDGYAGWMEWKFQCPMSGKWDVKMLYASKEERRCTVTFNGKEHGEGVVCDGTTEDWAAEKAEWFDEGCFEIEKGECVMKIVADGYFPHLQEMELKFHK